MVTVTKRAGNGWCNMRRTKILSNADYDMLEERVKVAREVKKFEEGIRIYEKTEK